MNSWILHTKQFAAKKGIKYNEALKDPENRASYKKGAGACMGAGVCMGCPVCIREAQGNGLVSDAKKAVKSSAKKIGLGKCGGGIIDEMPTSLVADAYNHTQLDSQKKYISL